MPCARRFSVHAPRFRCASQPAYRSLPYRYMCTKRIERPCSSAICSRSSMPRGEWYHVFSTRWRSFGSCALRTREKNSSCTSFQSSPKSPTSTCHESTRRRSRGSTSGAITDRVICGRRPSACNAAIEPVSPATNASDATPMFGANAAPRPRPNASTKNTAAAAARGSFPAARHARTARLVRRWRDRAPTLCQDRRPRAGCAGGDEPQAQYDP